jgi:hypothetical protein
MIILLNKKLPFYGYNNNDHQFKKIKWTSTNVKPVKIIVIVDKKTSIYNEIIIN